ncbi:MAG TPA: UbiA family prenyltransferase [Mycobacteriales bacterium]|nr:UbiA family prenyltransferase [Mycobacteriales bacterium]
MLRTTGALVRASHPEPTVAVTTVATALALSAGAPAGLVAAAFLTGQLSIGWSNDWIDERRDVAAGRTDKPVARGEVAGRTVGLAAAVAATACVPLSLALGIRAGVLHLLAVASAWSYNAGLKATAASWLPYALTFGAVPSVITLATAGQRAAPIWATLAGALLGVSAHLVNVLPDLDDDAATGVRGLPHLLGRRRATALAVLLLLAATVARVTGPGGAGRREAAVVTAVAVVLGLGLWQARRPGSRAAFRAVLVIAVIDVALLVAQGDSLRE